MPDASQPQTKRIELSLGPCLFNWSVDRLKDFYRQIAANSPVDRVCLGEVVCGKRMPFTDAIWPDIIEQLTAAGKQVIFSTLAQPASKRERTLLQQQAGMDLDIEINDMSMVPACAGRTFSVGPFINVYNEGTLAFLAGKGAQSWCPPAELPLTAICKAAAAVPTMEVELLAFGRLPLALSSRCYHARTHGLHKDSCQFICGRDPDGMNVATMDGKDFLAVNGIQTLSHTCQVVDLDSDQLASAGIRRLRLSPHTTDMVAVSRAFRDHLDGAVDTVTFRNTLDKLSLPGKASDGYLMGEAGWKAVKVALPA